MLSRTLVGVSFALGLLITEGSLANEVPPPETGTWASLKQSALRLSEIVSVNPTTWWNHWHRVKNTARRKAMLHAPHHVRARFGLEFDQQWQQATNKKQLVVLVHGFNSRPRQSETLITTARENGFSCAVLNYPNDQPIQDSAQLLSKGLKRLSETHPDCRVAIVAYSMGGLVSRAVVEIQDLDPGNVDRLILVAPPNHGSTLASCATGIDIFEYLTCSKFRNRPCPWYSAIEDGLAEASHDMMPGSRFLNQLNRQPRNPLVRYTILLGNLAPLDLRHLRRWEASANNYWLCQPWASKCSEQMIHYLRKYPELVQGQGDGLVAVQSGKLKGVSDTMVLPFDHLSVISNPTSKGSQLVRKEILRRLNKPN